MVVFRAFRKLFLPAPVRAVITVFKAIEFIRRGLVCLWHRKLEVEVLDALSIGVSLLRGDFNTAGSVIVPAQWWAALLGRMDTAKSG